jgi:hypothetical protein
MQPFCSPKILSMSSGLSASYLRKNYRILNCRQSPAAHPITLLLKFGAYSSTILKHRCTNSRLNFGSAQLPSLGSTV